MGGDSPLLPIPSIINFSNESNHYLINQLLAFAAPPTPFVGLRIRLASASRGGRAGRGLRRAGSACPKAGSIGGRGAKI